METLKILNKKKIKEILNKLNNQYGFKDSLDYVFFMNSKDKVFLLSKKFKDLDVSNIKINSLGLYFCSFQNNEVRLSVEGSQLIGDKCNKNIINLNEKELKDWLIGRDIENIKGDGFKLIKNNKDYFGCGKIVNNKLLNFVPKEKRVAVI